MHNEQLNSLSTINFTEDHLIEKEKEKEIEITFLKSNWRCGPGRNLI